ncbi:MAG: alpha/beta hydrolase family esterase [Nocardioidaceae bacterium]
MRRDTRRQPESRGLRALVAALVAAAGLCATVLLAPGAHDLVTAGDPTPAVSGDAHGRHAGSSPRATSWEHGSTFDQLREIQLRVHDTLRHALVYRPEGAQPSASAFVVVHGLSGNPAKTARSTAFLRMAQQHGWVVAFPQGRAYNGGVRAWNAGSCCGGAPRAHTDDVQFLAKVAATLVDRYQVNANRVFYTGFSNGAMLGYRIACQEHQPFAGFAVLSGTLVSRCAETSGAPLLAINGVRDRTVPFAGSRWDAHLRTRLMPVTHAVRLVATRNGCRQLARRPAADRRLRTLAATGCPSGGSVQLVTVRGLGHAWAERANRFGIDETRYAARWLTAHAGPPA